MERYVIYKHVSPSGSVYIGQTKQHPNKRWQRDGRGYIKQPVFYSAIQKYGWDNFQHIILCHGLTKTQANIWEVRLIKHYRSLNKCYNMNDGGDYRSPISKETREKLSKVHKGKQLTLEQRQKISVTLTGRKLSKETREKLSKIHTGVKFNKSTKFILSQQKIGINNPMFGKSLWKGTIWMNNGTINRRVKLTDKEKLVANGWSTGQLRKIK